MNASPWTRRHLTAAAVLWAIAAVLLEWSWYGSSKQDNLDDVGPWVVVAGLAALAAGLGALVWLSRALRSVRARQQRIGGEIDRIAGLIEASLHHDAGHANGVADGVLHLAGTTLFHRPDCLLVRGKDATTASRAALERAGHRACGVCRP